MAVEILMHEDGRQVLICNTTDVAFGPVFQEDESAQDFLDWLPFDARTYYSGTELHGKYGEWKEVSKYATEKNLLALDLWESLHEDKDLEEGESEVRYEEVEIYNFFNDSELLGFADFTIAYEVVDEKETRDHRGGRWVECQELVDLKFTPVDENEDSTDKLTQAQNEYLRKKLIDL